MTDAPACFFKSDLRNGLLHARPPVGAEAVQRASREEEGRLYSQLPKNRQRVPHMAGVVIVERHGERGPRIRTARQDVGERHDVAGLLQRA